MKDICKDLADEHAALDAIVKGLDEAGWQTVTSFYGWSIKDEISHLAYFDRSAFLAATDVEAFGKDVEKMIEGFTNYDDLHDKVNSVGRSLSDADLLLWWRKQRAQLIAGFMSVDSKTRLPWYGPPMTAKSCATARLMETWAHGQDIVDVLKASRPGTDRLKHIAHIGVSTFSWSFKNRELEVPDQQVRVELSSPSNKLWTFGPEDAQNIVRGTAEDFCLVVTQRRRVLDTKLVCEGDIAGKWMSIAQAFAGPPEYGPE
ncbi:MAG: TIGR03084 family protein [Proteobacteria bacterium]|nr:TIGR03084 family protein [Pseudomonadota bacterium]